MLLPRFNFHSPASLGEACRMLDEMNGQAKLLAGGTDLLVNMKKKVLAPEHLIALDRAPELAGISTSKGVVSIGASTTAAELAENRTVKSKLAVLSAAAGRLGSPLIRNRATVGGNLVTARPAADTAPPLLALGAEVVLTSSSGERVVPLDEFFKGPGQTVIGPGEVLSRIQVPVPAAGSGGGYEKLGLRQTLEIAIVNVATCLTLDKSGKKIENARVVLGSVAPTPIRAAKAEAALTGQAASAKNLAQAALEAVKDAKPITDHRGTAKYRSLMIEVLTRRALTTALAAAGK